MSGLFEARDSFLQIRDKLHRELVEYVFHPHRLARIGYFTREDEPF